MVRVKDHKPAISNLGVEDEVITYKAWERFATRATNRFIKDIGANVDKKIIRAFVEAFIQTQKLGNEIARRTAINPGHKSSKERVKSHRRVNPRLTRSK